MDAQKYWQKWDCRDNTSFLNVHPKIIILLTELAKVNLIVKLADKKLEVYWVLPVFMLQYFTFIVWVVKVLIYLLQKRRKAIITLLARINSICLIGRNIKAHDQ